MPCPQDDGHAIRRHGTAGAADVAAAHRVVTPVSRVTNVAETDGLGDGGKVPGRLARHRRGVLRPAGQQLRVQQNSFHELAVVPPEQRGRREDFQQQRLPAEFNDDAALSFHIGAGNAGAATAFTGAT